MRHQLIIFLSAFIIILFTLANLDVSFKGATGAAVEETYAYTLDHLVHDFFETADDFFETAEIQFPAGTCGMLARELYQNMASQDLEVTSGYGTKAKERVATINFGMERSIGTLDMVKGRTFFQEQAADSMIDLGMHTTIRMPPGVARLTYYKMTLYGISQGLFAVTHGSFSTPSAECTFTTNECKCSTHARNNYEAYTEA
ncbi:hypothetical protein HY489_01355 [Candidatus Woesearchaeota archaeon]|nr:hypothetical protein [Candidatus Woesearchaeota archaeon]